MEHCEKMDAWILDMKDGRKERTVCQEAIKANPEKMEPNDRAIAILEHMIAVMKANREKMEAIDLKANPVEMKSELEDREVPNEDAVVKPVKRQKKRHRSQKLAAG
jgi:hypothetical protein